MEDLSQIQHQILINIENLGKLNNDLVFLYSL